MTALFCSFLTAGFIISLFYQSPCAIAFLFVLIFQLVGALGDPDSTKKATGAGNTDGEK